MAHSPMSEIDDSNIAFWNELCGTQLAQFLDIRDASAASLRKFDAWFFDFYPYVFDHVPLADLADRDVLEVGLGYGSLSQKIAAAGARYCGLDIAPGPVEMARHRLLQAGLAGRAEQGSILAAPFADQSFDWIITIGCLHHTGDMARAIEECRRLLRPGGSLLAMVYYAYSYRRWVEARRETLRYLWAELLGYRGVAAAPGARGTWSYDHNSAGDSAPHTDFISVKSLRALFRRFSGFRWKLRNINQEKPFANRPRQQLLQTRWPDICGLEIYATAVK
jgi:SAM-dependent methyltransferase